MPLISIDTDFLNVSPYEPSPAEISASGFVRINGEKIVVQGDAITDHIWEVEETRTRPVTDENGDPVTDENGDPVTEEYTVTVVKGDHSDPYAVASQSFVKINGFSVVMVGDEGNYSGSSNVDGDESDAHDHSISSSGDQNFVRILI